VIAEHLIRRQQILEALKRVPKRHPEDWRLVYRAVQLIGVDNPRASGLLNRACLPINRGGVSGYGKLATLWRQALALLAEVKASFEIGRLP
jgi:hypothetical protein